MSSSVSRSSSGMTPKQRNGAEAWPLLATLGCIAFAIMLTLNVHPIGDGDWFWYAKALRSGAHLYSGLHLPMQPLFVFATEWDQRLFGEGWLASKVLAVVQAALFCWAIFVIARRTPLSAKQQALLIVGVFGTTLIAMYYRFDDYHVTCHLLALFSIDVALQIEQEHRKSLVLWKAALLGILGGLSTATRLNDGALLCLASGAALLVFARKQRWIALAIYSAAAIAIFLILVLLTGDSIVTWAQETIFRAAAIKGGTGNILKGPLLFPVSALQLNWKERPRFIGLLITFIALAVFLIGKRRLRTGKGNKRVALGVAAVGVLGMLVQLRRPGLTSLSLADSLITGLYLLLVLLGARLFLLARRREAKTWNSREILFLFPFSQLIAGAMTSGQSPLEAYPPVAMALLVLPFVAPSVTVSSTRRDAYLSVLAILAAGTVVTKATLPYTWHYYRDTSFFTDRTWYQHPNYGPMLIEKPQLAFMEKICSTIQQVTPGSTELLAMPWPYANYFCHIPPWHGFVQTWYDTTSQSTMQQLVHDLKQKPPEWIVYERGLDTMAVHEKVFLHNGRLPHREMDDLVADRLRSGAWSLPLQRCFDGVDWLLIRTKPAAPDEFNDVLLPSTDRVNLCARTAHGYLP